MTTPLVSTHWVAEAVAAKKPLKFLDASWYLPTMNRNAHQEFATQRIPGAGFFDVDRVSDTTSPYPHMLPTAKAFTQELCALGIGVDDHVIIYDGAGIFSAPRVWWTFKAMGHTKVSVMDGGLPKWMRENHPLEIGTSTIPSQSTYATIGNTQWVRSADNLLDNLKSNSELVIDARPAPRFSGAMAEPRPGLAKGHIPGSINLPFSQCLTDEGTYRSTEALRALFTDLDLPTNKPLIASCGSGVTAAIVFLALSMTGRKDLSLYDGSWAEWGSIDSLPVEQTLQDK
ncbi:MAG: 3-mercaptopyruvate sulfurtransferase [Parvibaculaceae bacterium]|nr:3-mercaptopyruvate sulfurtransferase [Parvibaculaceae bacterium]